MQKTKADVNRQGWETADFPILCETCLGNNPYMRMTKEQYGKQCKICERPFTVFRWNPGAGMRFKKTEICQTCAKLKNVCQTCLLDLEYGLPTQVRDAALKVKDVIPKGDVNKEYYTQNAEARLGATETGTDYRKAPSAAHEILKKITRVEPYYKRNAAHICSFFVKGTCTRGNLCPYRHEMPVENELSNQNIKSRYYGENDPVANKILASLQADGKGNFIKPTPPEDPTITTVFVSGVDETITEDDLKDYFYGFGEIKSIKIVPASKCAFIQYTTRDAAETAIDKTFSGVKIKEKQVRTAWGKPQTQGPKSAPLPESGAVNPYMAMYGMPFMMPGFPMPPLPPGTQMDPNMAAMAAMAAAAAAAASSDGAMPAFPFFPPPPPPPGSGSGSTSYPSQDPRQMGASVKKAKNED